MTNADRETLRQREPNHDWYCDARHGGTCDGNGCGEGVLLSPAELADLLKDAALGAKVRSMRQQIHDSMLGDDGDTYERLLALIDAQPTETRT